MVFIINRREFAALALAAGVGSTTQRIFAQPAGQIMTVLGPIQPDELGFTLTHEHVLVDFIGAEEVSRARYDAEEVFRIALPFLEQARQFRCRTLVECTPAYIGRDPLLLKRLSQASGLHLLTNTGYYGAADDRYLPAHARQESAEQLAERWTREWRDGIEASGIRPGFIKIGVDGGPLSEVDRRLVQAAAKTHLASGLTIASHTGGGPGLEEIETLRAEGVSPRAWIWVHAQGVQDNAILLQAAEQGAWISLDGLASESVGQHLEKLRVLKEKGFLRQILLSHDAGWYHVGEAGGGRFRPYDTLFKEMIPALEREGYTPEEIHTLTVENPRRAFTIRVRNLSSPAQD